MVACGGNLEDKVRAWIGQCDTLYIVKAATINKDEYICYRTDLEEMAQKESTHKHLHFNGIVPIFFLYGTTCLRQEKQHLSCSRYLVASLQ